MKKTIVSSPNCFDESQARHTVDYIGDNGFMHTGNEFPYWLGLYLGVDPYLIQSALSEYFSGDMETIEIEPMPSPRPRATAFGGSARVYHPAEYTYYKIAITNEILRRKHLQQEHYYSVAAICYLPFPKGEAKIRTYNDRPHEKKPDFDNLVKGFVDSFSDSGLISDDGRLHTNLILKRYTTKEKGFIRFKLLAYPKK